MLLLIQNGRIAENEITLVIICQRKGT